MDPKFAYTRTSIVIISITMEQFTTVEYVVKIAYTFIMLTF